MNPTTQSTPLTGKLDSSTPSTDFAGTVLWRIELATFAVLIVLLNLPLLSGQLDTKFIFLPEAVSAGEWWRVFTFPFVHVSLYHLLLDATAFFILYSELRDKRRLERFGFMLAAGAGSLLASIWAAPMIQTHGLCGLSGIAHGLATVSALEMITSTKSKAVRRVGIASLLLVVGKSAIEAVTGQIAFASWHLGSLGFPIAVCHAGGVAAALLAWLCVRAFKRHFSDWKPERGSECRRSAKSPSRHVALTEMGTNA